jgi:O-antigen ligase
LISSIVYKGRDPSQGLLASRQSPWQDAIDSIRAHTWFGTGFGTADNGQDATDNIAKFSSTASTSAEHGSSYLAITTWVGLVGVLPFAWLLLMLLRKTIHTVAWMSRSGNPSHPAVPLAIVILAGMIHAGFEDWMFAPGYYLCVFYWSLAFVLVDYAPSPVSAYSPLASLRAARTAPHSLGAVAPTR